MGQNNSAKTLQKVQRNSGRMQILKKWVKRWKHRSTSTLWVLKNPAIPSSVKVKRLQSESLHSYHFFFPNPNTRKNCNRQFEDNFHARPSSYLLPQDSMVFSSWDLVGQKTILGRLKVGKWTDGPKNRGDGTHTYLRMPQCANLGIFMPFKNLREILTVCNFSWLSWQKCNA